jgi:tetratricopeptide (TPR) repeat protein
MEKESTSFWADIKKYEDILAKDPKSYCFAPLSELYRKLGLLDDAIGVAQRGTDVHPEYIGGYMALGRAFFEKGLREKSKECLERVVKATPENLLAQKLLFQIYSDEGSSPAAERALQFLVSFNPEDIESRLLLEAMRKSSAPNDELGFIPDVAAETRGNMEGDVPPGEDVFADAILSSASELQLDTDSTENIDSEEMFLILDEADEAGESETPSSPSPLPTLTLAELYASQGFQRQALSVYEELLREDPENVTMLERVNSLRRCLEENLESTIKSSGDAVHDFADRGDIAISSECGAKVCFVNEISREKMILETMEEWLNSVRRIRECR